MVKKATSNKQKVMSNKQKLTSNKQRAKSSTSFCSTNLRGNLPWHHCIRSSETLSSFGNSTGCLQLSLKHDLCKLPPTQSTPFYSKKRSNREVIEFSFSLLPSSLWLSLYPKDLISAANFLACTIFITLIYTYLSELLLIVSPHHFTFSFFP